MEETKDLLRKLALQEIPKLDRDVKRLRRVALGLIVIVVLAGVFVWRQSAYDNCTSDRARVVGGAFYTTYNALDKILVEDVGLPDTPANHAKGVRDFAAYKVASAEYRTAQKMHPVCHRVWGVW